MHLTFSGEKGSRYLQKKESHRKSREKDKMEYILANFFLFQINLISLWTKEVFLATFSKLFNVISDVSTN